MQKGSEIMLVYNIEIHGDASGNVWFSVNFQSSKSIFETKKFNSADTEYIYNTVEKLTEALKALPTSQE